jgi:pimeloyl-ACP methyl ester carboxylesterase
MELVFISGWATSKYIWNEIGSFGIPVHFLEWNTVLEGSFRLPESCILIGWSLGGQLAMELSTRPEVKGMVLVSSMSCIASSENRPGVDPSTHSGIVSMLGRSREGYFSSFFRECGAGNTELQTLVEDSAAFSTDDLISGLDTMFNRVVKPAGSVPVTLVHGTSDRIIPFSSSIHIIDEFAGGSTSILPVAEGNHLLPLTHPRIITQEVKQLVQNTDS